MLSAMTQVLAYARQEELLVERLVARVCWVAVVWAPVHAYFSARVAYLIGRSSGGFPKSVHEPRTLLYAAIVTAAVSLAVTSLRSPPRIGRSVQWAAGATLALEIVLFVLYVSGPGFRPSWAVIDFFEVMNRFGMWLSSWVVPIGVLASAALRNRAARCGISNDASWRLAIWLALAATALRSCDRVGDLMTVFMNAHMWPWQFVVSARWWLIIRFDYFIDLAVTIYLAGRLLAPSTIAISVEAIRWPLVLVLVALYGALVLQLFTGARLLSPPYLFVLDAWIFRPILFLAPILPALTWPRNIRADEAPGEPNVLR